MSMAASVRRCPAGSAMAETPLSPPAGAVATDTTPRAPRPARLLGDVGGTHTRFSWQEADAAPLVDTVTLSSADYPTLAEAMRAYLARVGRQAPPWCAFGIANPITGDAVRMTNHDWSFSIRGLQQEMGFERLVVINDFTALALALPALGASDLRQLGGGAAAMGSAIGLIGPGTGLGVSGLLPAGANQWIPLQCEGGHVSLAASNEREAAVIGVLREAYGHVSAERAVSGVGLEALFKAVCRLDGRALDAPWPAATISERAIAGSDPQAVEALDLFCAFLGSVAGNLALTLGALGGIYLGGGIVPRLGDTFTRSRFRDAFEAKGRFRDYLAAIPVFIIEADVSPALLGASRAL